MTTLQSIGARLALCLPKLKHYGLLMGLGMIYMLTTALRPTEFATENHFTEHSENTMVTMGMSPMMAKVIRIPSANTTDTVIIDNCDEQISFESDSTATRQYVDTSARNSVSVICPQDSNLFLKAVFTRFDLAAGDVLHAFDGRSIHAPLIGTGSGVGNAAMNGGWVVANCDKTINPSGCLTFQFTTNGDNNKGTGWEAWISCEGNTTTFTGQADQYITLACDEYKASATIEAGHIMSSCGLQNDSVLVEVLNAKGRVCMDTCIRADSSFIVGPLAIGQYKIRRTLKAIPSSKAESYLVISPTALTCNDHIEAVLGSACMAVIRPDNILENTCDTTDILYYDIAIKTLDGRTIKTGTSRNGQYPIITRDDIEICNGRQYQVEITRVYDYSGTCCSEGLVKDICWSNITFVDGTRPWFNSHPIDTLTLCNVDFDKILPVLTKPEVLDNCDSVGLAITDHELISGDECSDVRTYLITWKATDLCGNIATQKDTLRILRPKMFDAIKLPDMILSCGEDTPEVMDDYDKLGIIKIPMPGDTLVLSTEEYVCNYILIRNDEEVPHPGGKKVTRHWSVLDACSGQPFPIMVDTQLIEFIDTLPPTIDCSPYNTLQTARVVGLPPFSCTMEVTLPKPTATDLCLEPAVEMFKVEQLEDGVWKEIAANLQEAGELSCDTFRVGWQAIDTGIDAPLRDTCYEYFHLKDVTPPRVICTDTIQVSYDREGTRLYARDIEHRSTDDCELVKIEIRRDHGAWGEYIDFVCTDVHKAIPCELRFTDKGGNQNTCSFSAVVLDFIPPYCADLPDYTGSCDEFHKDQLGAETDTDGDYQFEEEEWTDLTGDLLDTYNNKFGDPQCEDNLSCVSFSHQQQYQVIYSDCGKVKAQRRYRIIDWNGEGIASSWQYQDIDINYTPGWSITLPVDFYGQCGDSIPDAGIQLNNSACDLLAWEHEDRVFDVVPDACYKVVRTYFIKNWCTYKTGDQPIELNRDENDFGLVYDEKTVTNADYPNHSYFTYTQVLKVIDNEAPTISINDVPTCIYGVGDVEPFGVEDQTPGEAPYECDTIRIFSAEASDCEKSAFKNFSFTYEVYEDGELVGNGDGSKFFWVVRPKVIYTVKFTVFDNCGNSAMKEKEYQFWDCSKPVVSCIPEFNIEVLSDSLARLDAFVLDKGSYDNCTPSHLLRFKVWHSNITPTAPNTKEGVLALPERMFFDCDDRGAQTVYLYVLDEEDNYDLCIGRVNVNNTGGICVGDPLANQSLVAGKIHTTNGEMVEAVNVSVAGNGAMPSPETTTATGTYSFKLKTGQEYEVIPKKNENPLNGVSTFDLILISKHILGIEAFDSPYKYIAADVNKSGTITAFDLVQLRQLILNISSEFPNNESWRFIDATYEFATNTPLQEDFKERININNHNANKMDADFIAVKIGDLNGNAKTNALQASTARTLQGSININVVDQTIQAGEEITVDFNAEDLQAINGYQFALAFNGLDLLNIEEGLVKTQHFGQTLTAQGILLTSWDQLAKPNAAPIENARYFSLKFRATKAGKLSEFLQLQPRFLPTEAYSPMGELLDVKLHFERTDKVLKLEQNNPNPFKERTRIGFQLPKAGQATLTILDLQGRVLEQKVKAFSKGYHEWIIEGQSLTSKGILYYQLATDQGVLTKKMMLIE